MAFRLLLVLIFISFSIPPIQANPHEILSPHILIELSDEAAKRFRDSGNIPDIIHESDIENPNLVPIFYVPNKEYNRKLWYKHGLNRWFRLQWANDEPAGKIIKKLESNRNILSFSLQEPDYVDYIPNDYDNYDMWGLDAMDLPTAWDIETGSEEVIITTIDTGCKLNHEDLSANIRINPGEDINENGIADLNDLNEIDDDENGFIDDIAGWDFVSETNVDGDLIYEDYGPPDNQVFPDIHGHGTHVAGSSAAVTDNDIGIASASGNVTNMPLRAGFAYQWWWGIYGAGFREDFAAAIQYAADNGSDVISISFGGTTYWEGYQDAIDYAYDLGVLIFASAGNSNNTSPHYPSDYEHVLSVAALDDDLTKADFSNYGDGIDISAPGVDIWSTMTGNFVNPQDYVAWDGTSMASPNAAAVAALILSYNPELTVDLLESVLLSTCEDIYPFNPNYQDQLGAGLVNAGNALLYVPLMDFIGLIHIEISLNMIPIQIPNEGGTFEWTSIITHSDTLDSTISLDYWTEVLTPDGETIIPDDFQEITIEQGDTLTNDYMYNIPAEIDPGVYTSFVKLGFYPDMSFIEDGFEWEVFPAEGPPIHIHSLNNPGRIVSHDYFGTPRLNEIPAEFQLQKIYPNPFNSTGIIRVDLPESALLSLKVYNITGQTVSVLNNTIIQAGSHSFSLNGDHLSAGMYIVHALTSDGFSKYRKAVLIK